MIPELRLAFIIVLTTLALGCHWNKEVMAPPSPGGEPPAVSPAASPAVGNPPAGPLRLNHLQVKGTHNSYHRRPAFSLVREHAYEHAPLDVQLQEYGVRVVELDIHPSSRGYEVYHLPVIDSRSTCGLLVDCLGVLKKWSDSHPGHHALFVWIEPKDEFGGGGFDMDALDEEILSVWPRDRLVTPALVRGEKASVREAIEEEGWPELDSVRNRAMFMLLDRGPQRKAYLRGGNGAGGAEGRIMFVLVNPGEFDEPFAAVAKIDNPASRHIPVALGKGIIVGSNVGSASGSDEGNSRKLQAGLEGGVHLLTGDFPAPVKGRAYWFRMPGGSPSRCNPVTAPAGCRSDEIENLAPVGGKSPPGSD